MDSRQFPHGLYSSGDACPKLIVLAADAGQFGVGEDEGQASHLSWQLERAVLTKSLAKHGMQISWWDFDETDVADLRIPLILLNTYELFQSYGGDLQNITDEAQADQIAAIENMRDLLRG